MNETPLKAIRAKCLDCCCDQQNEVRNCPCEDCALWMYRFGKNPNRKMPNLTEEEKIARGKRLAEARKKKGENKDEN